MAERDRKEAAGEEYGRAVKPVWAIVTVQGILDNDFYIGTLRQGRKAAISRRPQARFFNT